MRGRSDNLNQVFLHCTRLNDEEAEQPYRNVGRERWGEERQRGGKDGDAERIGKKKKGRYRREEGGLEGEKKNEEEQRQRPGGGDKERGGKTEKGGVGDNASEVCREREGTDREGQRGERGDGQREEEMGWWER